MTTQPGNTAIQGSVEEKNASPHSFYNSLTRGSEGLIKAGAGLLSARNLRGSFFANSKLDNLDRTRGHETRTK